MINISVYHGASHSTNHVMLIPQAYILGLGKDSNIEPYVCLSPFEALLPCQL